MRRCRYRGIRQANSRRSSARVSDTCEHLGADLHSKSVSPAGLGKPCTLWLVLAHKPIRHISRDVLLLDVWLGFWAPAQHALDIPADVVEMGYRRQAGLICWIHSALGP